MHSRLSWTHTASSSSLSDVTQSFLGACLARNTTCSSLSVKLSGRVGNPYWLRLCLQPPAPDDPSYSLLTDCPAGTERAGALAAGPSFIKKSPFPCNAPSAIAECALSGWSQRNSVSAAVRFPETCSVVLRPAPLLAPFNVGFVKGFFHGVPQPNRVKAML